MISNNSFEEKQIIKWALQAAKALKYMHYSFSPKAIHRDVKPDNMLMNRDLILKISDFGLSKWTFDPAKTFCGTVCYMAPEILRGRGRNYDEKVDVYSWGKSFWRCFKGRIPPQDNLSSIPIVSSRSEKVNLAIRKAVKNDPRDRPSMRTIVDHLSNL